MSLVYECDKCGTYTDNQIVLCPGCAGKGKESATSASANSNHTATLEAELRQMFGEETFSFSDATIYEMATRLNEALQKQK